MEASLDTDIVIHLYSSEQEGLIFSYFEKVYMHEYLYNNELKRKSLTVFETVTSDVNEGLIEIISNKQLIDLGIKGLFDSYLREYKYLFDNGELFAVSLAKAMGLIAFVSDDTKQYGPHDALVKELIEDVMPFAFYELLFLRYLSSDVSASEMQYIFGIVNSKSMYKHPMNFKNRMLTTVKRFSSKYGSDRDCMWINGYCKQRGIIMRK